MQMLIEKACAARNNAYAPYSNYKVGAALEDNNGHIHIGCNVENAAYPQGTCAEAGAISAMVSQGGTKIKSLVIAGVGASAVTPCGGCRQKLREFAGDDMRITMCDENGVIKAVMSLGELFPASFGPHHLKNNIS